MYVNFKDDEVSFQADDIIVLNASGLSKVTKPKSNDKHKHLFKIKMYISNEQKYVGNVLRCDNKYCIELTETHTITKADIDIENTIKQNMDKLNLDMNDKKFNESLSHYLNHFMLTNSSFA